MHIQRLSDTSINRRMADGHINRTGHKLDAVQVSEDGELWNIVRMCCGDPHPAKERLDYLRTQIDTETFSWGELAELQSLAEWIEPGDVQLLEWAGVPEVL